MDLWDVLSDLIAQAVGKAGGKGAPVLWAWLKPAYFRTWRAFAPKAGRWAGKVKVHTHISQISPVGAS